MTQACPRCGLLHPAGAPCFALSLQSDTGRQQLQSDTLLAGRYHILRTIHCGGMSVVYLAEDTVQGRRVALKELRLSPGATAEECQEAEAWFARESFLLSALRHRLIPTFYSVFREADHSYIAQEYVEGENLDALIERQGPPAEEAVIAWGIALCDLLSFLHRLPEPVIFRDLKPANILLRDSNKQLAVVDFGIARHFQQGEVGTVVGTPGYAPPEQYQGLATPQSDIYALGVTLYRLLTGYNPEQGTPFHLPPIWQINPHISSELAAIVERAVRLNPAERFDSAGAMGLALRAVAAQYYGSRYSHTIPDPWPMPGQAASTSQAPSRGRRGWGILVAMLLIPSLLVRGLGAMQPSTSMQEIQEPLPTGYPVLEANPQIWQAVRQSVPIQDGPPLIATSTQLPAQEVRCAFHAVSQIGGGAIVHATASTFWAVDGLSTLARLTPNGLAVACTLPTTNRAIGGITVGPDGNLWFTEYEGGKIGRLRPDGRITEFSLPAPASGPSGITTGHDGNLWFTEMLGNAIGRLTPTGQLTEYPIDCAYCDPHAIITGPNGDLWFANENEFEIGRITLDGRIARYPIPAAGDLNQLTSSPDGAIWFTARALHSIGRIDQEGSISYVSLPTQSNPAQITAGPDGNIWYADYPDAGAQIGRVSADGTVSTFPVPSGIYLASITDGLDGTLWWVGSGFGRLTTSGQVLAFADWHTPQARQAAP